MPNLDIIKSQATDYTNSVDDVEVPSMSTDGVSDEKETTYQSPDWQRWWGYFNSIADLQSALLMKSIWNVGRGYTTDKSTQPILDKINGWGTDTFEDILFNLDVIRNVNGDSFAEIIRNDKGTLVNLKSLDPSSIKIVVDGQGIIKRYEQTSKLGERKEIIKFKPQEILHLSANRLADQIHGISRIKAVEETIKADNENTVDLKSFMHHQAKPFILFKLKTDDPVKINDFISKMNDIRNKSEDLIIPDDENIISWEVVQVNISSAIFEWRNDLRNKFYRTFGLPLVIFGSGGSTESGGKMEMFAHETLFTSEQRYLERQIWSQLAIRIKLKSPVGLSQNLLSDEQKDKAQGLEIQPQDTTAGAG